MCVLYYNCADYMCLYDFYFSLKKANKDKIVLVKYGNFYRCFANDALIMSYLFDYKISKGKVGFPISIINKVLLYLKNKLISVVIINDRNNILTFNIINNKYLYYLELSKNKDDIDNLLILIRKSYKMKYINNNNYLAFSRKINTIEKITLGLIRYENNKK